MAQAEQNAKVKFYFIPEGKTFPSTLDENTIYFDAQNGQIFVGSDLIATNNSNITDNYPNRNEVEQAIAAIQSKWIVAN